MDQKLTVLLVDDNYRRVFHLTKKLSYSDYLIIEATGYSKAWEVYSLEHPDVAVINIGSSLEGAIDLMERIRSYDGIEKTLIITYHARSPPVLILPCDKFMLMDDILFTDYIEKDLALDYHNFRGHSSRKK